MPRIASEMGIQLMVRAVDDFGGEAAAPVGLL